MQGTCQTKKAFVYSANWRGLLGKLVSFPKQWRISEWEGFLMERRGFPLHRQMPAQRQQALVPGMRAHRFRDRPLAYIDDEEKWKILGKLQSRLHLLRR